MAVFFSVQITRLVELVSNTKAQRVFSDVMMNGIASPKAVGVTSGGPGNGVFGPAKISVAIFRPRHPILRTRSRATPVHFYMYFWVVCRPWIDANAIGSGSGTTIGMCIGRQAK